MGRDFTKIKAWQLADDLTVTIYEVTERFPKEERYGLISQMRRAAVSVAANVAEGSARTSRREYSQFLSIATGSLAELRHYLNLAKRLRLIQQEEHKRIDGMRDEAARVLNGLLQANERQK